MNQSSIKMNKNADSYFDLFLIPNGYHVMEIKIPKHANPSALYQNLLIIFIVVWYNLSIHLL